MDKVEVISKELIKPSSPAPFHLRNFKLSLLDQLAPPVYIPILASSFTPAKTVIIPSKATKIKDDYTIDCNDEGVEIFHGRVKIQPSKFFKKPHVEVLDKLFPGDLLCSTRSGAEDMPLAIQVNSFECGRVPIGLGLSHKIADGAAMVEFISKWAATARGTNEEAMDVT
ncbi:hypothetical protein AAC387_Pa02g2837 [Persea americana]